MATSNNSRDVRMTLSVETLGSEDIQKLQNSVATLARQGGDAAPEFQRLADQIGRIGEQSQALQAFSALTEQTGELRTRQEQAAVTAEELRAKLAALSAAALAAGERQAAVAAELDAAKTAARATRDELATLTATTDRAGKAEDSYRDQVESLKVAKIAQRAEIERLSGALAAANAEVAQAEQAEAKLGTAYDRAAASAEKAAQAVRASEAAVAQAADHALDLGVATDNVATAQAELVQNLQRTSSAAAELQANVDRLAERERELAGIRLFEEQAEAAKRLLQTGEYARLFDQALQNLAETERARQAESSAAQWQTEAEAIVNAAHAAQELARQTAILEAAERELAAQAAFEQQAQAARELQQAGEYVRFWREELERADAQAAQTANEARIAAERISNAFSTLGVRSAQELETEIANVRASMETIRTTAGLTGNALNTSFAAGEARIRQLERDLRELNGQLTISDRLAGLFHNSMGQIAVGNVVADAVGYLVNKVKELAVAFVSTIAQTDQMRKALMAVYKDSTTAASQFEFLRKTANDAGVAVGDIGQAFVRFSASTQASGIGLQTTNALFAAVTRAAGTLGLSGEQVTGMLEALSQMASKGTVSMEELRQQLGDRLPGALSLVAKGLGLTDGALIKLVESGGLAARDLFPALTTALGQMQGETDGLIPSYERLKNVLTETAQNAGDSGWTALLIVGLKALTALVGVIVLPLSALSEILLGAAKSAGILVGALVTLTNPTEALGRVVTDAAARQGKLTEAFDQAAFGTGKASDALSVHNERLMQVGTAAAQASESIGATARAQEAQAFATKLASDSTLDLSSKIVQLKAFIDQKLASQEKEIEASHKLAKAAQIQGASLVDLAKLRGSDYASLEAQVQASDLYAAALTRSADAQRAETELLVLKRDEIIKTAIAQDGSTKARQIEIDAIEKKIKTSQAETEQSAQAAAAAEQEAATRHLAVKTYQDNAAAIGEFRQAMELANRTLEATAALEKDGWATKEQVAVAARRAAEATNLYNDAVQDTVKAIDLESRARAANNNLALTKLELEQRNSNSLAQAARAAGDYSAALYYEIEARRKEIDMIRLKSEAMRLEADATLKALAIERDALDQTDPLLKQKQAEIDIRIANAKAKLLEADAGKQAIEALEREITALYTSSQQQNTNTGSRSGNTTAIYGQTQALREQIQVLGEFADAQDLANRGHQGDSVVNADGTRTYKDASGALGSTGVMQGYTISAEQNHLNDFLGGKASINTNDAAFIEANYKAAQANLQTSQQYSTFTSTDGMNSALKDFREATRAYEALKAAQGGSGGARAGIGGSGTATSAPTTASAAQPATQTVNINIGGRSTAVSVASDADAKALTAVLRQLESAAGVSG